MKEKWELWREHFPRLATAPGSRELAADTRLVVLPAGRSVFRAGSACDNYLLVVGGCGKGLLTTLRRA